MKEEPDGSRFRVLGPSGPVGTLQWDQTGAHNMQNALAAIAAARHAGVPPEHAIAALSRFAGVKRRMELRGEVAGVRVYDDFAHHPTAIATTLEGLRKRVGNQRIIAILEPRSNTMRMGVHKDALAASLEAADLVHLYAPTDLGWDPAPVLSDLGRRATHYEQVEDIVSRIAEEAEPGDHLLVMSNGGFGGIHQKLLDALTKSP
jgi:UDP-N-acetylmuramate: L-alanyl-gamma-D-glutamyl-meso-diaminopimelate ligase